MNSGTRKLTNSRRTYYIFFFSVFAFISLSNFPINHSAKNKNRINNKTWRRRRRGENNNTLSALFTFLPRHCIFSGETKVRREEKFSTQSVFASKVHLPLLPKGLSTFSFSSRASSSVIQFRIFPPPAGAALAVLLLLLLLLIRPVPDAERPRLVPKVEEPGVRSVVGGGG